MSEHTDRIARNILKMQKGGASDEEIQAYVDMEKSQPEYGSIPDKSVPDSSNTGQGTFLDPLTEGLTFGLRDEIKGTGALFSKFFSDITGQGLKKSEVTGEDFTGRDIYEQTRDSSREDLESFMKRNPKTALALEVGGSLATGGLGFSKAIGTQAFKQAPKAKQLMDIAKISAGEGAVYGFGKGEGREESVSKAATEGLKGMILGPAIQRGMQKALPLFKSVKEGAKKIQENIAPTVNSKELKAYSKFLFKQLDDAKIQIKDEPYQKFAKKLLADIHSIGISGRSRKTMSGAMNELAEVKNPTFTDLFKIKKLLTSARIGNDSSLKQAANSATKQIDEFMSSLKPSDIDSGDVRGIKDILLEAKDTWNRQAQTSTLEEIVTRAKRAEATLSGDADLAIRAKLRSIMDSERKSLPFDEGALEAMDNIIVGTPKKNIYRRFGEMAPGSRTARGEAPTITAAAFGAMKTGKAEVMLVFAALPSIIGGSFKALANKGTKSEIDILMNSIVNKNQPELEKIIDRIVRKSSAKIGMSSAALSTAILGNLDANPGWYKPDKEMTSLGDMISP